MTDPEALTFVEAMRTAWSQVSDALDGIPGGMHSELEDAASAMWKAVDAIPAASKDGDAVKIVASALCSATGMDPAGGAKSGYGWRNHEDDARAVLAALRAPVTAGAVPDGWRLVPVEPTEAMLSAAYLCGDGGSPKSAWSAMLSAAPSAPSAGDNA